MPVNSVDIVGRKMPTARIWNKLEQQMNPWPDSWDAMHAPKLGEIDL